MLSSGEPANLDYNMSTSLACMQNVTTAMENYDLELFMKTITDYDGLSKIEPFLTTLLLQIRKMIANDDEVTKEADDEEESAEGDSALI